VRLLATCERRGTAFLARLEQTYYAGEAHKDFEVVILPALREGFGFIGLFLAKKSRLPAERLQREIEGKVGPVSAKELRERDVIFLHPGVEVAQALAEFVVEFLRRRVRTEDN